MNHLVGQQLVEQLGYDLGFAFMAFFAFDDVKAPFQCVEKAINDLGVMFPELSGMSHNKTLYSSMFQPYKSRPMGLIIHINPKRRVNEYGKCMQRRKLLACHGL